jgi:cytochrome c556
MSGRPNVKGHKKPSPTKSGHVRGPTQLEKKMRQVLAIAALLALACTAVFAQNAAGITQRKEAMKAFGGATKAPAAFAKGEAPFDLAQVQASLKTIQTNAAKAKDLFGDDTKDGDTNTLPVAFEKKADLMAKFEKIAAAAKAAEGTIKDEASFKTEWPKVAANCGECHKEYRKAPAAK